MGKKPNGDNDRERNRRKKSKTKKGTRKEDERDYNDEPTRRIKEKRSLDRTSSSDGSRDSYTYKKKRKESKKHKKKKRKRHHDKSSSPKPSSSLLKRNYQLADALLGLLQRHQDMAGDLPIMLIRLTRGTTFSLDPNQVVTRGVADVFRCLEPFGVVCEEGQWMWKDPSATRPGSQAKDNDLLLVKVVHALLSEIGINVKAFQRFEQRQRDKKDNCDDAEAEIENTVQGSSLSTKTKHGQLQQETRDLLARFATQDTNESPSLAAELIGIMNLIMDGKSIDLDGLSNHDLKDALHQLFQSVGLEQYEMENDSNDEEEEYQDAATTMGYGLPEQDEAGSNAVNAVRVNLEVVLRVCQEKHSSSPPPSSSVTASTCPPAKEEKKRRVVGPTLPPSNMRINYTEENQSSDDEEGPLPLGQVRRKQPQGPMMAHTAPLPQEETTIGSQREAWMMVPGEHEFLQGIQSKSGGVPVLKNRSFVNKKSKADQSSEQEEMIDPSIQAEVNRIQAAHQESRGPSLLDQHLQSKKEREAAEGAQKKNWKWSRQNDLDSDRRVDKNALRMMMGGAKTDLQSKFQGGYGRG